MKSTNSLLSNAEELFKLLNPLYFLLGLYRTTEAFSLRPGYVAYHLFSQLASSKSLGKFTMQEIIVYMIFVLFLY